MIFLDTHALVWLYEGLLEKFPQKIRNKLDSLELFISPMIKLELDLLYEIGRINKTGMEIWGYLHPHLGVNISKVDFYEVVEEAQHMIWTRDPFDRLIVANASIFQA